MKRLCYIVICFLFCCTSFLPQLANADSNLMTLSEGVAFDDDIDPEVIKKIYRDGSQNENNGEYIRLGVIHWYQTDSRWGSEIMKPSNQTIAEVGCALTSAAMVGYYWKGIGNPKLLNTYLGVHAYNLNWNIAGEYYGLDFTSSYPYGDLVMAETFMLGALRNYMPTIALLRSSGGTTHWVVVTGYSEWRETDGTYSHCFYINDPSSHYNRLTLEQYYDNNWEIRVIRLYLP